jgi:hypothetical protein
MAAYSFTLKHLLCGSFIYVSSSSVKTFEEAKKDVRKILNNEKLRLKKLGA